MEEKDEDDLMNLKDEFVMKYTFKSFIKEYRALVHSAPYVNAFIDYLILRFKK